MTLIWSSLMMENFKKQNRLAMQLMAKVRDPRTAWSLNGSPGPTGSGAQIPDEGHFLRSRNQASFEVDEEEEFTENLSSDTTAETPNKNIKIREPVLEFGAVDKPFKEFGPALEFEGSVMNWTHGYISERLPII